MTKRVEFRDDEFRIVWEACRYYETVLEDEVDSDDKEWALSHRKRLAVLLRAEQTMSKGDK